jgi:hypothetical protein
MKRPRAAAFIRPKERDEGQMWNAFAAVFLTSTTAHAVAFVVIIGRGLIFVDILQRSHGDGPKFTSLLPRKIKRVPHCGAALRHKEGPWRM